MYRRERRKKKEERNLSFLKNSPTAKSKLETRLARPPERLIQEKTMLRKSLNEAIARRHILLTGLTRQVHHLCRPFPFQASSFAAGHSDNMSTSSANKNITCGSNRRNLPGFSSCISRTDVVHGVGMRWFASGPRKRDGPVSNRAAKGLYGGRDVGFGNKVSHSERKTRRMWKPNVQIKRLWSEALQEFIRFRITTHALRCVDKAGGLDSYILKTPPEKLNSTTGEIARARIMAALQRQSEER